MILVRAGWALLPAAFDAGLLEDRRPGGGLPAAPVPVLAPVPAAPLAGSGVAATGVPEDAACKGGVADLLPPEVVEAKTVLHCASSTLMWPSPVTSAVKGPADWLVEARG